MPTFKAATIQMTSTARVSNNLTKARNFVKEASLAGAKIVGLPENFSFMGKDSEKIQMLDDIAEQTKAFLSETAKDFGVYLLGGGFPTRASESKAFNSAVLFDPSGTEIFNYNKAHLFDQEVGDGVTYLESRFTESGKELPSVVETDLGFISSAICYDIRFPEVFRVLSRANCELCFLPAAFTEPTGKAHWEVLLRARAIENLMYILAPAQWGTHDPHGNRKTWGHSMIISPWGEVLAEKTEGEGFALAEINLDELQQRRKNFPALSHRLFF